MARPVLRLWMMRGNGVAGSVRRIVARQRDDQQQPEPRGDCGRQVAVEFGPIKRGFIRPGGVTNFRLCFGAASLAMLVYLAVACGVPDSWSMPLMAIGGFLFGGSFAVFGIAMQTTGINLAPPGCTTLYVNAIMIVIGVRGMIMPLVSAEVVKLWGVRTAITVSVIVSCGCLVIAMIPGIDGTEPPSDLPRGRRSR